MDRLPFVELDTAIDRLDINILFFRADEITLDRTLPGFIYTVVSKTSRVEGTAQFSVDPQKQVLIEPGRNTGGIVVGLSEGPAILFQIETDEEISMGIYRKSISRF